MDSSVSSGWGPSPELEAGNGQPGPQRILFRQLWTGNIGPGRETVDCSPNMATPPTACGYWGKSVELMIFYSVQKVDLLQDRHSHYDRFVSDKRLHKSLKSRPQREVRRGQEGSRTETWEFFTYSCSPSSPTVLFSTAFY